MKKTIFFFFLLISLLGIAQTQKTDESANSTVTQKAEFPGGEEAYRKELYKMINGYIDMSKYAANGIFTFSFDVDIDEKLKI